jgi:hypothetical protein
MSWQIQVLLLDRLRAVGRGIKQAANRERAPHGEAKRPSGEAKPPGHAGEAAREKGL